MNNPKIFGIGLSRTGTTSLNNALNVLGIKAIHLPKYKYVDGRCTIDGQALKNYTALTDTPIALAYKILDEQFPHSKFILTIREKLEWLNSCKRHFADSSDDHDYLRMDLYGTTTFDKEKFSNAYDKHLQDVCSYFKNRKSDLLIIDISNGEGWEKLCPFLGKEIPNIQFPKQNVRNFFIKVFIKKILPAFINEKILKIKAKWM